MERCSSDSQASCEVFDEAPAEEEVAAQPVNAGFAHQSSASAIPAPVVQEKGEFIYLHFARIVVPVNALGASGFGTLTVC